LAEQISPEEMKGISEALKRADSRKRKPKPLIAITAVAIIIIAAILILFYLPTPPDLCSNGVQDQGEEGIDCGGNCPGLCAGPSCFNGIQDQGEEGIDCGGPCPSACKPLYIDTAHVLPTSVSDLAIDLANDRIYVLDEMRHRIMVFDSEFNHIKNFGEERESTSDGGWNYVSGGITNDKLIFPASIYLANNKIYVLDRAPRIQVFNSRLEYERTLNFSAEAIEALPKIPDTPNADGGMSSIVVSGNGDIYVADEVSNAVAIFDSGLNLKKVVSLSDPNGPNMPGQIAFDNEGNLLVADSANSRISVFDSELNYIKGISSSLLMPIGVAVSDDGKMFVLDRAESKLNVFESNGNFLEEIGGLGTSQGSFYNPRVAKLDSRGNLYVLEEGNNRIQIFDSQLELLKEVKGLERTFSVSLTPFYPAIAPNGDIAFSDPINSKVFVLGESFETKAVLGGKGFGNNHLNTPKGLAFDSEGKLYVSDPGNRRVQVFSPDYTYLSTIMHDELIWPLAISVSEDRKVYVVDDKYKNILIFNQAGEKIGEIGAAQGITLPLGILAEGGKIYITDDKDQTIEILDYSLRKLKSVSGIDAALGVDTEFNESLAIDSKNRLLLCDNRNRSVVAFDLATEQFSSFGSFGSSLQELSILEVATSDERIVVTDMEQHVVKVFDNDENLIKEITITDIG